MTNQPVQNSLSLQHRTGLPNDLRILLAQYPRGEWQYHDNLGEMARFWLQRHDMFRQLGAALNHAITEYREDRQSPEAFAEWFLPRIRFFLQQLHGHHQIEDQHYFPVFERAEIRLGKGFRLLDSDHRVLHEALEKNAGLARSLFEQLHGHEKAIQPVTGEYADHTAMLVSMMLRHLEDEEDLIIPLILDRGEETLGLY